jgi:hypothetical protein
MDSTAQFLADVQSILLKMLLSLDEVNITACQVKTDRNEAYVRRRGVDPTVQTSY